MDDASIQEIVTEIQPFVLHRSPGKIFQLNAASLAIDFGLRDQGYLFVSVEPAEPRIYLIKRRVRDLEKASSPLSPFGLALRKELSGTQLTSLEKDSDDRVLRFAFDGRDELGNPKHRVLVVQLTGRSANILLLEENKTILQTARRTSTEGQQVGDLYRNPGGTTGAQTAKRASKLLNQIQGGKFSSASEAADAYFTSLLHEKALAARIASAHAELRKKVAQQQKLLKQLQADLESHENADQQKQLGDLLLANLSTARREGDRVKLINYFADDASTVELELDKSTSLQEEAARRFGLYSRSKRAIGQITTRIEAVRKQLAALEAQRERLESAPPEMLATQRLGISEKVSSSPKLPSRRVPGARRYVSSDGFEILVGRTARDNDQLTFKIAKPNDLWLHAADYGGSHVVVRNPTKKPIPHRTLVEAAQLAAWFSQAKKDPKVDVHYTERKFVSKMKGAKPGLVRLQRFKSITLEPKEAGTRT